MSEARVTERGLTAAEVAERVRLGRTNAVATAESRSLGHIVRANVLTPFNALLGSLLVVILLVAPIQDALFGGVIVANTLIGVVQEWRAKRTLDRLAVLGETRPRVRRDGSEHAVPDVEVVLDDVVLLGPGDKVPVDGTVLEAVGLEVDESLLTGEADPVGKQLGDAVRSGSFVAAGSGAFRATAVGPDAYAAQLAAQAREFRLVHSQLRTGIDRFIRLITWVLVPTALALLVTQLRHSPGVAAALAGTVAGVVPMVPEGLVLLTSVAFAVGVVRLGRYKVLVQELPAIEVLARVDTVCVDKTGTLTEPELRVLGVEPLDAQAPEAETALAALAAADPAPNPTLAAIAAAYPRPPDWPISEVEPFSSARKWSAAHFTGHGTWLLGGPDVLLPAGHPVLTGVRAHADQGQRVLLLAHGDGPAHDGPAGGVRPVALVLLGQQERPDAADTLDYFARQGVRVVVISGDDPRTVGAVARRVGVAGADDPRDARTLPEDADGLATVLDQASVYGRVSPQQKRAMVTALQAHGHVVAMTGDGVNDVLALKDADIGIAMGSGSGAAKAVAQLVLLEGRFATLPYVVAEGRRVIGNVERVASLFLTKTVYATLLAVAVAVARVPFPFLPRHLTLVGSLTIGIPAFFLALAPTLRRAPPGRFVPRVLRFSGPAGLACAAATYASYGLTRAAGAALPEARTTAVITLTLVALAVLVVIARPWTWWRLGLVAAMAAGFALVLAVPFGRDFFALSPSFAPPALLGYATALAVLPLLPLGWWLTGWRADQAVGRAVGPAADPAAGQVEVRSG